MIICMYAYICIHINSKNENKTIFVSLFEGKMVVREVKKVLESEKY
jgi:hypothetical protein